MLTLRSTAVPGGVHAEGTTAGSQKFHLTTRLPGQDSDYDRTFGGNRADLAPVLSASGVVLSGPGLYYGYIVTTTLTTGGVTLYDTPSTSTSAEVVDTIATTAAQGTVRNLATPMPCSAGMYASFASTAGTVKFLVHQ